MKIDLSVLSGLTLTLETMINSALKYDPAAKYGLEDLKGILAVESTFPELTMYLFVENEHVFVQHVCDQPITTHVKGKPLAFLSLIQSSSSIVGSDIDLSGDPHLLQQWRNLLHDLDIDWEQAISEKLGDLAGPVVAQSFQKGFAWFNHQFKQQQSNVKNFVTEEINLAPSRAEFDQYSGQVESLEMDVDRLGAKIDKLAEALGVKRPSSEESSIAK